MQRGTVAAKGWLVLGLVALLAGGAAARANTLVADLSEHLIAITTAFTGTDVVLFGTGDGASDIVVTVLGPREDLVVRRKARVAGIWINRDRLAFQDVPSYYVIAASGPIDEIAQPEVVARHELGTAHLKFEALDTTGLEIDQIAAFEDALVRNKQRVGLYSRVPSQVTFVSPQLFRTTLHFPANVPSGIYQVQVFELKEGQVAGAQRSTLVVSKIGLEADVFDFARKQAALYGLIAIVLALTSGWLAEVIFRRG